MTDPAGGKSRRGTLPPMRIGVRLFAGLRELAGTRQREVELPPGATAGAVWEALGLGEEPSGLLIAVNKIYAARDTVLADGDEVALIPPVSGGAFLLSEEPLSLAAVVDEVASDDAGAIATFSGTTRSHSRGRDVVRLEYEAYEGMAEAEMERIAEELRERHAVLGIAIHHRIGVVTIGETSVVIAVSAAHRGAALTACAEAIDTLKVRVPLWKKEIYVGGEEWIGQGS